MDLEDFVQGFWEENPGGAGEGQLAFCVLSDGKNPPSYRASWTPERLPGEEEWPPIEHAYTDQQVRSTGPRQLGRAFASYLRSGR